MDEKPGPFGIAQEAGFRRRDSGGGIQEAGFRAGKSRAEGEPTSCLVFLGKPEVNRWTLSPWVLLRVSALKGRSCGKPMAV
jgi:hypothetical protein